MILKSVRREPKLEHRHLPQPRSIQWRDVRIGRFENRFDIFWIEQFAFTASGRKHDLPHKFQILPSQIFKGRHGKIAFGPVNHASAGMNVPCNFLQNVFATILSPCNAAGMRALSSTNSWSRKGTRASSPHAMVMLSTRFHRIVHQHDGCVEVQGFVDGQVGASGRIKWVPTKEDAEIFLQRSAECTAFGNSLWPRSKKCRTGIVRQGVIAVHHRRVPVVAAEDLVGPLTALYHPNVIWPPPSLR
jgi:hypothetical protein